MPAFRSANKDGAVLNRLLFIVIIIIALAQSYDAIAGDYTVSYAFAGMMDGNVTNALNEEGRRTDCIYGASCKITLSKSDLEIWLDVSQAEHDYGRISVTAYGGRSHSLECCLFSDGQHTYIPGCF